MSSIIKNIFVLLGLLIVIGMGIFLFTQKTKLETDSGVSVQVDAKTQESLRRLKELQQINLSTELFTDSRFTNLVDFSSEVTPVLFGRENPFE